MKAEQQLKDELKVAKACGNEYAVFTAERLEEILRQIGQEREDASRAGYDEACTLIEQGFCALADAVGIDPDEFDDDTAPAVILSDSLLKIAEGLKPLGITRDDETHEFRATTRDEKIGG